MIAETVAFLDAAHGPEWMTQSSCAEAGTPDLFYPSDGNSAPAAKAICEGCPVREQCLEWALSRQETHGIWGGLTERERRQVLANPTPRPCGRPGCTEPIPATASRGMTYHSPQCQKLAYYHRVIADLDPKPIVAAYKAGGTSVNKLAARFKVPAGVIGRILDQHDVPRPKQSQAWVGKRREAS